MFHRFLGSRHGAHNVRGFAVLGVGGSRALRLEGFISWAIRLEGSMSVEGATVLGVGPP